MKYNTGFAPIAILLIILGVAAIGGGAYYVGKSSNKSPDTMMSESDYLKEQVEKTANTSITNTNTQTKTDTKVEEKANTTSNSNTSVACDSNSKPSITVLSPNGGETFTAGQQVKVTWKSCNVPNYIGVVLNVATVSNWHQGNPVVLATGGYDGPTVNDGIETFTIPLSVSSGQYKIWVRHEYDDSTGNAYEDSSDNYFTINSAKSPLSTTLPKYIYSQEGWPPVIKHSSATYSCITGITNPDINEETEEKSINGRKYCIKSSSEGAAGTFYVSYTYTTPSSNGNGTETTSFVLRYTSCGADSTPNGNEINICKANQSNFNSSLNLIIDSFIGN
jgi:hypothetical protein